MLLPAYIAIAVIVALCLAVYAYRSGNDDLKSYEAATGILLVSAFWPGCLTVMLSMLILNSAVVCLMTSAKWISRKIDKLQDMAKKKTPGNND